MHFLCSRMASLLDYRGPHNFQAFDCGKAGVIILCTKCGWEKKDCQNLCRCSGAKGEGGLPAFIKKTVSGLFIGIKI